MPIEDGKISMRFEKLDRIGFEKLFREHYQALCRHSARFVRDTTVAEDIVQDCYVRLWEIRKDLTIHTSLKSYIYTSVRNKSIDYIRKKSIKTLSISETQNDVVPDNVDLHQSIEFQELSEVVTNAMEKLPDKCYTVFSLSRFGMLSNKEIADQLNIAQRTVESQIYRATKILKAIISKYNIILMIVLQINFYFFS
jgi:RNA polymerase sigma-70 factor, ECF subfamily